MIPTLYKYESTINSLIIVIFNDNIQSWLVLRTFALNTGAVEISAEQIIKGNREIRCKKLTSILSLSRILSLRGGGGGGGIDFQLDRLFTRLWYNCYPQFYLICAREPKMNR